MFTPQTLTHAFLPYINDRKESYGRDVSLGLQDPSSPDSGRKKLVIEFSSPNLASEFQGKHLRSTILGASIAKMHRSMGWDVVKINYLGDWGKPMGLLGAGWERFGSEELFEADPVGHLLDVYHKTHELFVPEVKASKGARDAKKDSAEIESQGLFAERNAFFRRMEDGDEKALALWKRLRDISVDNYTQLYARMNITFDDYSGESQVSPETMAEVEEILKSREISEESEGASLIDLKKYQAKKLGTGIIRDRAGSSTYLLRDLAAVLERSRKYSFGKMIYVVAGDHNTHFQRLIKILELMDMKELADKLEHVPFSESSHMAEKLGKEHTTLDVILDRCAGAFEESLDEELEKMSIVGGTKESAAAISITTLLTQELSTRRSNDHPFDLSLLTSFELGTGLGLLYWNARLVGALAACARPEQLSEEDIAAFSKQAEDINLLRLLLHYPEVTQGALKSLEPAAIMAYLTSVTAQLEACFEDAAEGSSPSPGQIMLYEATRAVLEGGLELLGIVAPTS